ncbi:MAG: hypothetical protein P1P82_17665 [Bacteroidales bacterium]|nr:hypothetical protein [Bacteroidales bacterium]MDT8431642.1 hypothetical protein [Bacteroidales bacterium]
MKKLLTPILFCSLLFMLYSCGNETVIDDTCMQCHSTQVKMDIDLQFNQSAHRAGAIAVDYAGSRASCAQCHSHEGFVEYAMNGEVAQNITLASAWQCKTCHNVHKTFTDEDYALRLANPVAFLYDEAVTFDYSNSNLCANCHQSRREGPADMTGEMVDTDDDDVDDYTMQAGEFFISSTHYGPHHGAQANLMHGVGFSEIAGSASYPAAGTHPHAALGCTGCHMEDYADGMGGHTFNPSIASCTECHSGAEDFDVNGGQEEIADLLEELRNLLVAADVIEWVDEDEAYEPVIGVHGLDESKAFFNWIGIEEDRSHGVHNPTYIKALLENSIAAVQ